MARVWKLMFTQKSSSWRSMSLPRHRQTLDNLDSWFLPICTAEFECSNQYRNTPVILAWQRRKQNKTTNCQLFFFLLLQQVTFSETFWCSIHTSSWVRLPSPGFGKGTEKGHRKIWEIYARNEGGAQSWEVTCGYSPAREVLRHLESPGLAAPWFWEQIQAMEKSP